MSEREGRPDIKTFKEKAISKEMNQQQCLYPFGRMSISVQHERNSPSPFNIKRKNVMQGGLGLLEIFSTDEIPFV